MVLSIAECGCCRKRNWFAPGVIGTDVLVETMKFSYADTEAILNETHFIESYGYLKRSCCAVVFFASPAPRWIIEEFIDVAGGQLT